MIWMPWAQMDENARDLDIKRLMRMPGEILKVLDDLVSEKDTRETRMWKGGEGTLIDYGNIIAYQILSRDYRIKPRFFRNELWKYQEKLVPIRRVIGKPVESPKPRFFRNYRVFASHRYALWRKDKNHYWKYEEKGLPEAIVWPGGEN